MRFDVITSIVAVFLFMGYFTPLMIKLKDIPLAIVLLAGIVLVIVDVWQSLGDRT
jgi:hypothetical protein